MMSRLRPTRRKTTHTSSRYTAPVAATLIRRSNTSRHPSPISMELAKSLIDKHQIFCADRLVQHNVELAAVARQRQKLSALDLGRASPLRYFSATRLLSYIRAFELISMPARVWTTICSRMLGAQNSATSSEQVPFDGLQSGPSLWPLEDSEIARLTKILQALGVRAILLVTDGPAKIRIFDSRGSGSYAELTPYSGSVKERAGAGDALFARLMYQLAARGLKLIRHWLTLCRLHRQPRRVSETY